MRCFVAVEVPEKIRAGLNRAQEKLRSTQADIRWVKPDRMHLTLKFLGDHVEESQIEGLYEALSMAAQMTGGFSIQVKGMGAFPNAKRPKVLWAGVEDGQDELKAVAAAVDAGLDPLGFPREDKDFRSHLTLGRVRSSKGLSFLKTQFEKMKTRDFGTFEATECVLFESVLSPSGPRYIALERFPFNRT